MTDGTIYLSPNGQNITQSNGPATRMIAATVEGVLTLERGEPGDNWRIAGRSLTDRHVGQLVYEGGSGKLFAGAHADGGLWVSDDGEGKSWRPLTEGLDQPHIYALAARRLEDRVTLFLGTSPAALYRSDDLGESWSEVSSLLNVPDTDKWTFPPPPHIPHVKHIVFHPSQPETVYVCVEQGALLRSVDDGNTWVELDGYDEPDDIAYKDLHRLLINPDDHADFYLATGEGLYRSRDEGETWVHLIKRGDKISYPDFLQFDSSDSGTLFVAGSARNPGGWYKEGRADSSIARTTDGGKSWTELGNGLPDPMIGAFQAMSRHHWDGGMMLVIGTATGQIYASEDRGETWGCIADDLAPIAKDDHHMPFLGQRAGSSQSDRPGWSPGAG